MLDFDLECLEMCAKSTLEEKEKHDNEPKEISSSDTSSESEDEDEVEESNQNTFKNLNEFVSDMDSLNLGETKSSANLRPKIIELD